jgi:hypothetical protein
LQLLGNEVGSAASKASLQWIAVPAVYAQSSAKAPTGANLHPGRLKHRMFQSETRFRLKHLIPL